MCARRRSVTSATAGRGRRRARVEVRFAARARRWAAKTKPAKELVAKVYAEVKRGNRVLSDDEILAVIER